MEIILKINKIDESNKKTRKKVFATIFAIIIVSIAIALFDLSQNIVIDSSRDKFMVVFIVSICVYATRDIILYFTMKEDK